MISVSDVGNVIIDIISYSVVHSSWLRCSEVSRSFSSGSGSVINESSSGAENIVKGGAFNKLHCTAIELVSIESVISVSVLYPFVFLVSEVEIRLMLLSVHERVYLDLSLVLVCTYHRHELLHRMS